MARKERKLAVLDLETDPFKFDREPVPFAAGFFDGTEFIHTWGFDCVLKMVEHLLALDQPHLIYAHNGGRFDFHYFLPHIEGEISLINGRIVQCKLGIHTLRDSYAILPIPLSDWSKSEIDYDTFESDRREANRQGIIEYLRDDCLSLYSMVHAFREKFGESLTLAGIAFKQLRRMHEFPLGDETHDEKFRPFYFGGRVECLDRGVLEGDWKIYDVNSMYPHVMAHFEHPKGQQYIEVTRPRFDSDGWLEGYAGCMYFLQWEGESRGGVPSRSDSNEGNRYHAAGTFFSCSHDLRPAMLSGAVRIDAAFSGLVPCETQRFADFVDFYYTERLAAKAAGDKAGSLFNKLILNSAYGKSGLNPRDFEDWRLVRWSDLPEGRPRMREGWRLFARHDGIAEYWRRPAPGDRYYDVAIAASITSAARGVLYQAILNSRRMVYCDTDSVICEELQGVPFHASHLGHWKHEASGSRLALAGRKLYCLWDGSEPVKWASKGVRLTPDDIARVARGEAVDWANPVPTFAFGRDTTFIARTVKRR